MRTRRRCKGRGVGEQEGGVWEEEWYNKNEDYRRKSRRTRRRCMGRGVGELEGGLWEEE